MRARSGYEYTLLVRSCRQLLRFAAFQSKTNAAIDLESLRSSCIAQDRVWIATDEGEQNLFNPGLLDKVIGRPKKQPALTRVTRFEVVLDGKVVEPLGQVDLEELGPGSSAAIFAAGPFLEAEHGQITVTMGETQQAVGELDGCQADCAFQLSLRYRSDHRLRKHHRSRICKSCGTTWLAKWVRTRQESSIRR
jgi:hypothetical protein